MKHLYILLWIMGIMLPAKILSQPAYTQNKFSVRVESDIEYGIAANYAGFPDTLTLDLYKPVGDGNCRRPVLVIIHGGSWISGTKKDGDVVAVANQMAAKGYVVASIKYRLGTHKAASWTQWLFCSPSNVSPCLYICDSSEIFRAIYRGMQDAKGAIRFLKNRAGTDSTDANNVFVAGTSAGGFIAMAVAFLNTPDKKPASCYSIADAPPPAAGLKSCNPAGTSFARPDLGDVEGTLNTGAADASVKGVGCFFGGIPTLKWIDKADTPAVYLFHQYSDVIVSAGYAPPFARIIYECINGICQPLYFYPWIYGCGAIADSMIANGTHSTAFKADIIKNWNGNVNCIQNPPGHAIDNTPLRSQNMADTFAPVIAASGNTPASGCITSVTAENRSFMLNIISNPVSSSVLNFSITQPGNTKLTIAVYDVTGRKIIEKDFTGIQGTGHINLPGLAEGLYFLSAVNGQTTITKKFIVCNRR